MHKRCNREPIAHGWDHGSGYDLSQKSTPFLPLAKRPGAVSGFNSRLRRLGD